MNTRTLLLSALVAALLAPVAMASKKAPPDQPPNISEASLASYWQPAGPMAMPGVPAGVPDPAEPVCVSLGYQIRQDGSTSDYALLRSWTGKHPKGLPDSDAYALYSKMAVAATMQHHYAPATAMAGKPVAVFTTSTYAFGAAGADADALRGRCRIDNLADFIRKAQEDSYRRRGDLNKGRMDRARVMNPPVIGG